MMQPNRSFFLFTFAFSTLLLACARQGSIDGGPRDTEPPRIDSSASTPNLITRFDRRSFDLTFNEWVVLNNPAAQILVSPPLAKRPDVTLKNKTVTVKFDKDEQLKPNTTYTVNFGAAVKDLHEGNEAKDLRFVFSTGDFIDSLTVSGTVKDAFNGKPANNITVALYDPPADSAVWLSKPYYFAKTDKEGRFNLANLRPGAYQCVAFRDADANLKWGGSTDSLAFVDSLVILAPDTAATAVSLNLFASEPERRINGQTVNRYGLLRLQFTRRPDGVAVEPGDPGIRLLTERVNDTLLVWYEQAPASWQLVAGKDTVRVKTPDRAAYLQTFKLRFEEDGGSTSGKFSKKTAAPDTTAPPPRTVIQNPLRPALLPFSTPVASTDTSRWLWFLDTVRQTAPFRTGVDSLSPRKLNVFYPWKAEKSYNLVLLPGAVTDFFGVSNTDTLRRTFNVLPEKQLGAVNLTIEGLTGGMAYVLELLNNEKPEDVRLFRAAADGKSMQLYAGLPAGNYTLRLTEDRNGNGYWDTGHYPLRRQPERVFTKKLDQLRANWELDAAWTIQ